MTPLVWRSDIAGAVEVTSWTDQLTKAAVAAAVDHIEPVQADAVALGEVLVWIAELHEVITDVRGLVQFAGHVRALPFIDDATVTLQ